MPQRPKGRARKNINNGRITRVNTNKSKIIDQNNEKISQYKKDLLSRDINRQLHAVSQVGPPPPSLSSPAPVPFFQTPQHNTPTPQTQLRILLSDEEQPPIDAVIKSNCVPRLIDILRTRGHNALLFETAWVLTNICSGSHDHTMVKRKKDISLSLFSPPTVHTRHLPTGGRTIGRNRMHLRIIKIRWS